MKKHRKIYSKSTPLLPLVDAPKIYASYHVSWGKSHGVIGQVIFVNETNKTVTMCSSATGMEWKNPVKWIDLRHRRATQQKIEENLKQKP